MDDLVMPQPLSCRGVERHNAVREEIHPAPVPTVEVRLGCLGRDVNNAARFVQRLAAPRHQASCGLVGVRGPGVVTEFPRTWNQMEYPTPQTGSDIEGANSTGTAKTTDDQEIFISNARRVQADSRCPFHVQACAEMNGAVLPEAADGLAR